MAMLQSTGTEAGAKPSSEAQLRKQLARAKDYASWRRLALELDTHAGLDAWKSNRVSPHYQHTLIAQRLEHLQAARTAGDWSAVIYSLREGLHRNLGNLSDPELYRHTTVGTKYLIDSYIYEVVSTLNYLCDHELEVLPYAQKLLFFRHTGQSFGRSALMLSGGANMGLFHLGVVKALREQKLLPRVISGSSAGAIVAGLVGTRGEREMDALFRGEGLNLDSWRRLDWRQMVRQKAYMDIGQLEKFLRANIGEYTFEEAFRKTKRIINITVSPTDKHQQSRLLNYLTTPHLLVWSAVLASCSVPGLFPSVTLTRKDRDGQEKPYMASIRWVDGAIQSDLPAQRLAELYNVNHHIASQTNPHVLPFIANQARKDGWMRFLATLLRGELQHRSKQMLQLASYGFDGGLFKGALEMTMAIIDQQYLGDVTIHPEMRWSDYARILGRISLEDYRSWILAGERATWPKITMIRDQTIIGQTLEDCIVRLKKQRARSNLAPAAAGEASVPQQLA